MTLFAERSLWYSFTNGGEFILQVVVKLNQLLNDRCISQRELSRLTGIRQASINELCNNQTQRLPLQNLAILCETLNCEITDILELVKEPTN